MVLDTEEKNNWVHTYIIKPWFIFYRFTCPCSYLVCQCTERHPSRIRWSRAVSTSCTMWSSIHTPECLLMMFLWFELLDLLNFLDVVVMPPIGTIVCLMLCIIRCNVGQEQWYFLRHMCIRYTAPSLMSRYTRAKSQRLHSKNNFHQKLLLWELLCFIALK